MKMLAFLAWTAFAIVIGAWGFGTYVTPLLVEAYSAIYTPITRALGG